MGRNSLEFVDLHVHTWYSDSSFSPAEVAREAAARGVGILAVADHEQFEGSVEAGSICRALGISLIPAAELECTLGDTQFHILSMGADAENAALRSMAAESRKKLDDMSVVLIERMTADYPGLSVSDFEAYPGDRTLGGWKGLQYLAARGVTSSLKAGMPFYERYGVSYTEAGFPSVSHAIGLIHAAGGRAVLAHPGYTLRGYEPSAMLKVLGSMFEMGLDGAECYYPTHSAAVVGALREACRSRGAMITAGSDCHGSFGHTRIGEMNITKDQVDLRGLEQWL